MTAVKLYLSFLSRICSTAADGEFNVAVTVRTLSTGEIRIVYTPDKEWIFDEERAWPLTLDPTITVQVTNQSVEDTAAYSGRPNEPNIYWQNFSAYGLCRHRP